MILTLFQGGKAFELISGSSRATVKDDSRIECGSMKARQIKENNTDASQTE